MTLHGYLRAIVETHYLPSQGKRTLVVDIPGVMVVGINGIRASLIRATLTGIRNDQYDANKSIITALYGVAFGDIFYNSPLRFHTQTYEECAHELLIWLDTPITKERVYIWRISLRLNHIRKSKLCRAITLKPLREKMVLLKGSLTSKLRSLI